MAHLTLTAEQRTMLGKGVRALRKQALIPAELYGHKTKNVHLSIQAKEFEKLMKEAGESTVISLEVGSKKYPVLIHSVEKNYLSGAISHIDFYEVRMDEKIRAHVPIILTGEAPAVKELGGVLNKTMASIEVEALPNDLPRAIEVNISSLTELNKSIYVKELVLPAKVKVLVDPDTAIVSVTPPKKAEEVVPVAPVDVSAVKVEDEEKKASRDKEKQENVEGEGSK